MFGGVYDLLASSSRRGYSGEWEMEGKSVFGMTNGYPKILHLNA